MTSRRAKRPAEPDLVNRLALAEEGLAQLSRLQESILDAAGEGIYGTDTQGRITFVNPAAAELFGYQPEELIGKPAHETLHHSRADGSPYPADKCPINRATRENRKYRAQHEEEEVFWRKDGSSFPASYTYSPLEDDGRVVGGVLVFRDIGDRKATQERIARSERELREAQRVARVGSWAWDVAADTISWSDELFRIYGVDPQSFDPSYSAYIDRLLPEDRDWIQELISTAIMERKSFCFDHRVTHPDGSLHWVEGRGRVLQDGGRVRLVGTAMDITDRKEADAQVKQSEERYRGIFENAVEGIYRSSMDGRLLAINPAGARILGYASSEEAMEKLHNLKDTYVDPKQRETLITLLHEQGTVSGFEVMLRRADGELIWAELSARIIGSIDEPDAFLEGMMLDVSSRKAAEEILSQSEARTRAIVSSAPHGILTFSSAGKLIDLNAAAERLFGSPRTVMVGRGVSRLLELSVALPGDDSLWSRALEKGPGRDLEATALRDDGTKVPVEVVLTPTSSGRETLFVVHLRNLTEQRRMEEGRRDLEMQVAHMQKMEALGHLAGGIAHDFNNLLAVIQNYASFIREELGPEGPVANDIDQVLNAARRASVLTRQLVMFARKDSARPELVDLNKTVSEMQKLLGRVIGADIRVETVLCEALPSIFIDVGQLEQVVMNLALNARDAMTDGGCLTLTTQEMRVDEATSNAKPGLQTGDHVLLSVTDTGCGIPEEARTRIFEPFFTSKAKGQGTGLGLATVFGIMKRAGGYISFESEEGVGTTFHVYFPASPRS